MNQAYCMRGQKKTGGVGGKQSRKEEHFKNQSKN